MQVTAKVTSKGQITLPKAVRQRLGVSDGDEVEFVEDRQGIHVRRFIPHSEFVKWMGYLKAAEPRSSDDLVREMRGE